MENNNNNNSNSRKLIPFNKTKRLETIKKKARELSVLCNIDVCLLGTHKSQPDTWHTWPEDQNELARIVNRYRKKVEEKEPKKVGKRAVLEFDVDKALEGMSDEELRMVLDRVDQVSGDVDKKLDTLLRKQNPGTSTPMVLDLPSNQTMEEANSDKFNREGSHTTPIVSDVPLNQTMGEVNNDKFDSTVARKGPKIFGVFLTPAVEA